MAYGLDFILARTLATLGARQIAISQFWMGQASTAIFVLGVRGTMPDWSRLLARPDLISTVSRVAVSSDITGRRRTGSMGLRLTSTRFHRRKRSAAALTCRRTRQAQTASRAA